MSSQGRSTHPFILGAVEVTDMCSVTVMLKHPDYAKFSYHVEATFEFLRKVDGGMLREPVDQETKALTQRLARSKIRCGSEEVTSAVVDAYNRLVRAYRSMLPDIVPSCWNTPGLDDPRGRRRSVA